MKKFLSTFLALCMLIPCLSLPSLAATISANENSLSSVANSIVVDSIVLTEGLSKSPLYFYDPETGKYVVREAYYYSPEKITVYGKDGSATEFTDIGSGIYYNGIYCPVDFIDDQLENEWGAGVHNVTMTCGDMTTTFIVYINENPIESIDIKNVTLLEKYHGYTESEYDNALQDYRYFFKYNIYPQEFVVNFKNGDTITCYNYLEYEGNQYYPDIISDQSCNNQWGVGDHNATARIMGFDAPYTVTILENPVERIEFDNLKVTENSGYFSSYWDDELEENVSYRHFNYTPSFTVYLKDGTTQKCISYFLYDDMWIFPNFQDGQSNKTPWEVGPHIVTATLFGEKYEFTVEITESPIDRIEIDPLPIIETDFETYYDYDYETDESVEWHYYSFYNNDLSFRVYFKDGSVQECEGSFEYEDQVYYIEFNDPQTYQNQWGVGEHTVPATLCGIDTEFTVEILETPIERIEIDRIVFPEYDCVYSYTWDYDLGESIRYKSYDFGYPDITVVYKDGTSETITESFELFGKTYYVSYETGQSPSNVWGVGEHTVTLRIGDLISTDFIVEVEESPIDRIEVPTLVLTKGSGFEASVWDSESDSYLYYHCYPTDPNTFTIYMKDGSVYEYNSMDGFEFNGKTYYIQCTEDDQSYHNQWGIGTHHASTCFMGFELDITVEIVQSPIERIEVPDLTVIEGTNGYLITEYGIEYWLYYCKPESFTVYFTDGTVKVCTDYLEYNGEFFWPDTRADQSVENQWGLGEHTATLVVMGQTCDFTVNIVRNPVERIVVKPVSIMEGTQLGIRRDYDSDGNYIEYERYMYTILADIYLTDGTVLRDVNGYNGQLIWTDDDQSADNHWGVGYHTVTAHLSNIVAQFSVEIIESPISRIEVDDVSLYEGSNGDMIVDYDGNSYFRYYYSTNATVYFKDGSSAKVQNSFTYNGETYWIYYIDDQDFKNAWGIGTHTVTATLMGISVEFNVTITESPISRIEVKDYTVIEGYNMYPVSSYDPETDQMVEWDCYQIGQVTFTAYFKDGSETTYRGSGIYLDDNYEQYCQMKILTDQDYRNQWGIGTHSATAFLLGASCDFTVNIVENPIVRIEPLQSITVYEGYNCVEDTWWNDETGESITGYKYLDYRMPECNVYLKDGTVVNCNYTFNYMGNTYWIASNDTQDEAPWQIGKNTATLEILGVTAEYTVNLAKNPIQKIEIPDIILRENIDCAYYNSGENIIYNYDNVTAKIYFKDGTVIETKDGIINLNGEFFSISHYCETPDITWKLGETYVITATLLGVETTYKATVVENPYSKLTVSSGNELTLTFTKKAGGTDVYKITSINLYGGDENETFCTITTDSGEKFTAVISAPGTENFDYKKSFAIRIGAMDSNTVNGNKWVSVASASDNYAHSIRCMDGICNDLLGVGIMDYNGQVTSKNLDSLILTAANISAIYDNYETIEEGNTTYLLMGKADIAKFLDTVFGIKNADLSKSTFLYNNDFFKIPMPGYGWDSYTTTLEYTDGAFLLTYTQEGYGNLYITMDEDAHVTRISRNKNANPGPDVPDEPIIARGDLNEDGRVNSIDSNLMKRILISTYPVKEQADINRDGRVNSIDFNLLKRIILGTYIAK